MKRRGRRKEVAAEENFWPAFTDVISTIAIILFFLMLLTYIQNIITGSNLEYMKKQLDDTMLQLEASKAEISQAENNLRLLKLDLDKTQAELEEGQIALKLSQEEIEQQSMIIAASNQELGQLRQKLQGIALLRLDVLTAVKDSIEGSLGKYNEQGEQLVTISDNGNIVINESLVFDVGKTEVKPEGKPLLKKLAEAFEDVLDDGEVRASIDSINIVGHADIRGAEDYNRELSVNRAANVVDYMMLSNKDLAAKYGAYLAATGFSEYRPLDASETEQAYDMNRRIEISVTLKDSNIQNVIDEYLKDAIEFSTE